jgi:hypothetical protein
LVLPVESNWSTRSSRDVSFFNGIQSPSHEYYIEYDASRHWAIPAELAAPAPRTNLKGNCHIPKCVPQSKNAEKLAC